MSFGRLRRSTRLVSALVLLASVWQLPHRSAGDEICVPALEAHDESKHVFTSPAAGSDHAEHCAICHWTRLLKPGVSVRASAVPLDDAGAHLAAATPFERRDPAADNLPPRAPPASAGSRARQARSR